MVVVTHTLALADAAASLLSYGATLAGFIPNPEPVDPTNGSAATSVLFSMLKGGIIICAGLGALISILYLIFGNYASSPNTLSKGKVGIPVAALCIVLCFVTAPALNALAETL